MTKVEAMFRRVLDALSPGSGDPFDGQRGRVRALFADVVIEVTLRQRAFRSNVRPQSKWEQDPDSGTLRIDELTYPLQLLGSAVSHGRDRQWLWGWANKDWPAELVSLSGVVHDRAEQDGLRLLSRRLLWESDDGPWHPAGPKVGRALPRTIVEGLDPRLEERDASQPYAYDADMIHYLACLGVGLTDARGYYFGTAQSSGTCAVFLIPNDGTECETPHGENLFDLLYDAISSYEVYDERRAIGSFLSGRGLAFQPDSSVLNVNGVELRFDAKGRWTNNYSSADRSAACRSAR